MAKSVTKKGGGAVAGEGGGDVDAFLEKMKATPAVRPVGRPGRLMFALDATMSRQPTWDKACQIQAEMFEEAGKIGRLEMQVVFFRGQGEFKKSPWTSDGKDMGRRMSGVACRGGLTQIGRVLSHARKEQAAGGIDALVYVGDAMEEDADRLCGAAGELGLKGVPMFIFHEGGDPTVAQTFRQMARVTKGAYVPFDGNSAAELRALLKAVAVYAAGGWTALESHAKREGGTTVKLLEQLS